MRHEKLTGIGIILFRADDYIVVMETLGMKYGTKNTKLSNRDCKSGGTIDLSFKIAIAIVFFISQFYAHRDQIVLT